MKQLGREKFNNYDWMERTNVTKGVFANPIFPFMDLDDLCGDIEAELSSMSLGAGFVSQLDKIDEISDHRMHLLSYINDVLFDISEYLDEPLFKGFNEAMDIMASIDMRDAKTDNTIGVQVDVNYTGRGAGYSHKSDLPQLTLEDFIGSRYEERTGNSYGYSTYNQKVEGFADLFEEDYENLINNDILNMEEKSLKEYLDSLILKEFPHKKDSPYYLELIQMVSEITVVIPFYEAAVGKTLFTNDYLTETESNYKIISGTVSLVTLGSGAIIAKGGGLSISKMIAAELVSEVAADATIITCERVGAPSGVTVALAIIAGSAAGIATNKALLNNYSVVDLDDVVGGTGKSINPNEIRFSQSSVNDSKEIIDSMKKNGWVGDPIDVVQMPDNKITTIDNTRVAAARQAEIDVQAKIHSYSEPLPSDLIDRFSTKKGIPQTWGDALELRVGKQNSTFRNTYPSGSFDMPELK